MAKQLSVTVVSGSPGNDGTRLVEQLIHQSSDVRLTAIVPKRSKKRNRSKGAVAVIPTTERLIQLGQGCSCCTVRADLMAKVQKIADEQSAEHILIHTTPHTDLRVLAKTFTVADQTGAVLSDVARIGSLVTVVDTATFIETLEGPGARSLIERLELANVVLLEGASDASAQQLDQIGRSIGAINTGARVVRDDEGGPLLTSLYADQPFDLDLAEQRAAGASEPNAASDSVVKFSYQARRPFHPARLHALLGEPWSGVIRAKGTFWVASRPEYACALDVAGMSRDISPEGMWWATVPLAQRPDSPQLQQYLETIWHPEFGDRHQNLSIVGTEVDEEELRGRFEACLLTDEEVAAPDQWASMPDPFEWPANKS